MNKLIRRGVFETNSSSTHSITMCLQSDYDRWKNGEMYLYNEMLITKEQAQEELRKMLLRSRFEWKSGTDGVKATYTYKDITVDWDEEEKLMTKENLDEITDEMIEEYVEEDFDRWEMPLTYEQYNDDLEYEEYEEKFTTPSGEKIVAFGYYGENY